MKRIFLLIIFIIGSVAVTGCAGREYGENSYGKTFEGKPSYEKFSHLDTAMGTIIIQQIYADINVDRQTAGNENESSENEDGKNAGGQDAEGVGTELTEGVLAVIGDLEKEKLSWRIESSELAGINEKAGGDPAALSGEMEEILKECMEVSEASGGAFDITIGGVTRLWNIDEWTAGTEEGIYALPEESRIREELDRSGCEKLSIENHCLILPEGMSLDLGAVGKGIALTKTADYLRTREEVTGAVISIGGSVVTYGEKPDKTSWNVGIVDPFDTGQSIGTLSLKGEWCISTSGDYERYVEIDGIRYHHIMDPATGYPADSGVKSVTILTKDGFLSDALSTACFILGKDAGEQLAVRYGAEALFVDKEGSIFMTDGMKEYFHGRE